MSPRRNGLKLFESYTYFGRHTTMFIKKKWKGQHNRKKMGGMKELPVMFVIRINNGW